MPLNVGTSSTGDGPWFNFQAAIPIVTSSRALAAASVVLPWHVSPQREQQDRDQQAAAHDLRGHPAGNQRPCSAGAMRGQSRGTAATSASTARGIATPSQNGSPRRTRACTQRKNHGHRSRAGRRLRKRTAQAGQSARPQRLTAAARPRSSPAQPRTRGVPGQNRRQTGRALTLRGRRRDAAIVVYVEEMPGDHHDQHQNQREDVPAVSELSASRGQARCCQRLHGRGDPSKLGRRPLISCVPTIKAQRTASSQRKI